MTMRRLPERRSRRADWRAWAPLVALVLALAVPVAALAHPLGNFTVNRYSRVELAGQSIRVFHVVDMAEIPSVQERQIADADQNGIASQQEWETYRERRASELQQGLDLSIDGHPVPLTVEDSAIEVATGQADLPLIRLEMWLTATVPAGGAERSAVYRDRNDPARAGWREIVVTALDDASLVRSNVLQQDVSDALRAYPDALLFDPLDQRSAEWTFVPGSGGSVVPLQSISRAVQGEVAGRPTDAFTSLVTTADLNVWAMLVSILAAAFFGGVHAASPGHGKTLMAAYIVGTRGTFRHAAALAMSVTVSHTLGVLILGIVTVSLANVLLPEQLYPWLTVASGVIVLAIGLGLAARAIQGVRTGSGHHHEHAGHDPHPHEHRTEHEHGSTHSHAHEDHHHHGEGHAEGHGHRHDLPLTWRNLFALGLAGGMVPSASALVVLLAAIALGRLGFGLILIVAFGLGMAVVLVSTGVLLVYARRLLERLIPAGGSPLQRRITRAVPVLSALAMTLVGAVVAYQGFGQIGAL